MRCNREPRLNRLRRLQSDDQAYVHQHDPVYLHGSPPESPHRHSIDHRHTHVEHVDDEEAHTLVHDQQEDDYHEKDAWESGTDSVSRETDEGLAYEQQRDEQRDLCNSGELGHTDGVDRGHDLGPVRRFTSSSKREKVMDTDTGERHGDDSPSVPTLPGRPRSLVSAVRLMRRS
jgi:hypothetical protein